MSIVRVIANMLGYVPFEALKEAEADLIRSKNALDASAMRSAQLANTLRDEQRTVAALRHNAVAMHETIQNLAKETRFIDAHITVAHDPAQDGKQGKRAVHLWMIFSRAGELDHTAVPVRTLAYSKANCATLEIVAHEINAVMKRDDATSA